MLVIVAHPDDEVFASGTICLCAEKGLRAALVCVTDGEGGSTRILHPGQGRSHLADIRRREVTLSARALGVEKIDFLGFPDVGAEDWDRRPWDTAKLTARLASLLEERRPSLVLSHGPLGGYGHPAHRRTGECVLRAAEQVAYEGSVFSFCGQLEGAFYSWRFDEPSDVRIDSRDFIDRRMASLSYHQSEAQFFLQPYRPGTPKRLLSALVGYATSFLEFGRKRMPVDTARRFFSRFPYEGLVLQRGPTDGRGHFFSERLSGDRRVRLLT